MFHLLRYLLIDIFSDETDEFQFLVKWDKTFSSWNDDKDVVLCADLQRIQFSHSRIML